MAGNVIQCKQGADRVQDLTLLDGQGQPVTTFTGAATLAAAVWAGDDQGVAFAPTAAWIDAGAGTVRLTFPAASTALLQPGTHLVQLKVTAGGLARTNDVATLQILASPGAATAVPTYITSVQLFDHIPWLNELQSPNGQAGFAEQRGMAREWLDEMVMARYAAESAGLLNIPGTAYGASGNEQYMREQLAADKLLVRPWVVRACAYFAASEVLKHQVGTRDKTSYQTLSEKYEADARDMVRQHAAEVDTNSDGVAEIRVALGSIRVARG